MAAIPGVTGVTSGLVPLLSGDNWGNDAHVQGYPCGPDVDCDSRYNEIGAGYFKTLGVQLKAGREFTTSDRLGCAARRDRQRGVCEEVQAGQGCGRQVHRRRKVTTRSNIQIVGLVPDVKYSDVKDSVPPVYYQAMATGCADGLDVLLREDHAAAGADAWHAARDDQAHRSDTAGRSRSRPCRSRCARTSSSIG